MVQTVDRELTGLSDDGVWRKGIWPFGILGLTLFILGCLLAAFSYTHYYIFPPHYLIRGILSRYFLYIGLAIAAIGFAMIVLAPRRASKENHFRRTRRGFRCMMCNSEVTGKIIDSAGEELVFLYCDKDPTVLTFDYWDKRCRSIADGQMQWPYPKKWDTNLLRSIERELIPCPCGGRFSFDNALRCPKCGGVLAEPMSATKNLMNLGHRLDSRRMNVWKE